MSGSVNPIKKENNEKSKVRPQNMSEKIELWPPHKKIKKKKGEGSKYVGEDWPCDYDYWIKNDKKERRRSNYVGERRPPQNRQ